jgi:hypothetical protein
VSTRRLLGTAALGLGALALVAGCSGGGGGGGGGFNERTQGGKGESSVKFGAQAKIPPDFPSAAVPLPQVGALQAVVTGDQPPNKIYTLTYGLGGNNGVAAGRTYGDQLERAGYKIKNLSSIQGSDGGFTQFDAVGKNWDLSVVAGKGSRLEPQSMSIQVATHGTLSDLQGLDDGNTSAINGDTSGTGTGSGSSTTSTPNPLAGG